ncbi:Ig-like domain-containing protein [Flammeovirga agarivorans]|uniref:T9SS type A sorting domain-containing protein n=1 Tax=Flammeovirga agarivorans TaxID=2726742 RepID=A0A7X8XXX4_9BACT|nr:Ig-like domain-containing protein [Flammeovirga agarivorans]NLR93679.1 T9SS type A sorting domain-containing protein [Flammeovirga agarivorans]
MRLNFTASLLFTLFTVGVSISSFAQTFTDDFESLEFVHEHSDHLIIDHGNPLNFNNDSSRIVRSSTEDASLIYHFTEITDFNLHFWSVDGDQNAGDLSILSSNDGVNYTSVNVNRSFLSDNSSLRTLESITPTSTLSHSYLKIVISGGDASWKAQLGAIQISYKELPNSINTDELTDFNQTVDHSGFILSTDSEVNFNNDNNRLVRSTVEDAHVTYAVNNLQTLNIKTYTVAGDVGNADVNVYYSEDNINFTALSIYNSLTIDLGYRAEVIYSNSGIIPSKAKYIRVQFSNGNAAWKTHLGSVAFGTSRASRAFYLSNDGNDTNNGSIASPWASLEKISATSVGVGDSILFEKGDTFYGHFIVNGSGSENSPLLVSSYGNGELPIISGVVGNENGGDYQEALLIENNDNIIIDGIEINNERIDNREGVSELDAFGIQIVNSGSKSLSNFIIRNSIIRNVYAPKAILKEEGEDAFNSLEVSGIKFYSTKNSVNGEEKNINNILVEDNYFTDIQRLGVYVKHDGGDTGVGNDSLNANYNSVFRNNEFVELGGTSILPIRTFNCLIEHNIFDRPGSSKDPRMPGRGSSVWNWRCFNTVIQYNKCLSTRGHLDSHGIHIDHENVNTFIQYNYMEDCEGGFVEILGGNLNSIYRFNVSINDGWRENPSWTNSNHTIWVNEVVPAGTHYSDQNFIYNNTVYMDSAYSTSIDIDGKATYIFNNVFYAKKGRIGGKQVKIDTHGETLYVQNNLFYGDVHNNFSNLDNSKVVADPLFYAEGARNALGYQLKKNSPAENSGVLNVGPPIPSAGTGIFAHIPAYPTEDFYGNPVDLFSGSPNIGAINNKNGQLVPSEVAPVESLQLSTDAIALNSGSQETLIATTLPAYASNHSVNWTSNNTGVVTVDDNGTITAISAGVATIIATTEDGSFTKSCTVTVNDDQPVSKPIITDVLAYIYAAKITWQEGNNATYHRIQYKQEGKAWNTIDNIQNVDPDEFWISNLLPGQNYSVRIRAMNTTYMSAWSDIVNFTMNEDSNSRITSSEQLVSEQPYLAPNPVQHRLNIKGLSEDTPIKVLDLKGNILKQSTSHQSLDVSGLQKGIYIVMIEGFSPIKFIKQ